MSFKIIVALSHFNKKLGSSVFYAYPKDVLEILEDLSVNLTNLIEQQITEGFFAKDFEDLRSFNYYFEIYSDWSHEKKEKLMSTIIINEQVSPETEELISLLCKKFVVGIKSIEDIFTGLYIKEVSNYDELDKEKIRKNKLLIKSRIVLLYWDTMEDLSKEINIDNGKIPPQREEMVEAFMLKIQENPAKKIIYLREFLDNFKSISNKDKEVILNSLQDEKNSVKLKEKMASLVTIFL